MKVTPVQENLMKVRKVLANPKVASFAQNTVCAIAVETTLKATGRPAFIYYDKHANEQSKKYAATKELLYQTFCLYDSFQAQINNATTKKEKNALERKFTHLLHTNKDYRYGKGLKELSSIASTVFILALCAPILSQIILHPVMDLIFGKKKENKTKA